MFFAMYRHSRFGCSTVTNLSPTDEDQLQLSCDELDMNESSSQHFDQTNITSNAQLQANATPLKPRNIFENIDRNRNSKPEKKQKLDAVDTEFVKFLKRKNEEETPSPVNAASKAEPEDSDRLFLMSMLPYLNSMTPNQKLKARIKFMEVVFEITTGNVQSAQQFQQPMDASYQGPMVPCQAQQQYVPQFNFLSTLNN